MLYKILQQGVVVLRTWETEISLGSLVRPHQRKKRKGGRKPQKEGRRGEGKEGKREGGRNRERK